MPIAARNPWTERPLPEVVRVAYPLSTLRPACGPTAIRYWIDAAPNAPAHRALPDRARVVPDLEPASHHVPSSAAHATQSHRAGAPSWLAQAQATDGSAAYRSRWRRRHPAPAC